jgi:hypothetical protein
MCKTSCSFRESQSANEVVRMAIKAPTFLYAVTFLAISSVRFTVVTFRGSGKNSSSRLR